MTPVETGGNKQRSNREMLKLFITRVLSVYRPIICLVLLQIVPVLVHFAFHSHTRDREKKEKNSLPLSGLRCREDETEALCGYIPCKQGPVHCGN